MDGSDAAAMQYLSVDQALADYVQLIEVGPGQAMAPPLPLFVVCPRSSLDRPCPPACSRRRST